MSTNADYHPYVSNIATWTDLTTMRAALKWADGISQLVWFPREGEPASIEQVLALYLACVAFDGSLEQFQTYCPGLWDEWVQCRGKAVPDVAP